jgi:hypothetical protein
VTQVHDLNGGVHTNGLFWTVPLHDGSFRMSPDGRHASLHAKDVLNTDSFVFAGSFVVPATIDLRVRWEATEDPMDRGSGDAVDPTDPAAFLGRLSVARASMEFSGSEIGFAFHGRASSEAGGFAELGTERNGAFL